MARKIELKVINGAGPAFSYGDLIEQILRWAPRATGLTLDEVIRAVEALKPLEAAIADGAEAVVFTDEQWRTLVDKLAIFPFNIAAAEIADFGLHIRNAEEIT
jgi:flagellar biosynthesis regulator FlaF